MGAAEEVGAGWLAIVGAGPVSPVVLRFCTRSVSFTNFCSISFHLLSSSLSFSLAAFFSSFTLDSSDEICLRQEQSLAHSPQEGHLVPFPLLLTSLTQVSTLEAELGSLDSCSLERCECVESHLISSTSSSFRLQAPDGPGC